MNNIRNVKFKHARNLDNVLNTVNQGFYILTFNPETIIYDI